MAHIHDAFTGLCGVMLRSFILYDVTRGSNATTEGLLLTLRGRLLTVRQVRLMKTDRVS